MISGVLFILLILILSFLYRNHVKKYDDINKLPGPSTFQFLKEIYFNGSSQGVINYFRTLNQKYGPTVKVWVNPLKPILITSDMEYVNRIYKANDHRITPCFSEVTFLRDGFTVTKDYDIWKHDKQLITKTFSKEYIDERLDLYSAKYDELICKIKQNEGKPIDLQDKFNTMFCEIIMHSLNDPKVELTKGEVTNYLQNRLDYFDLLLEKMNSLHMVGFLHRFTKNYRLSSKCEEVIIKFGHTWLKRFEQLDTHLREKNNVVYAMLNGGIPDERIVDNITVLIQGGHDTGIFPVSLSLQEMANNPHFQQKILEEILFVLGPDKIDRISLEDISKMPYLHAVVKESLRRYHSIPFSDRRLLYDMTINNIRIPKDTLVMFNFPDIMTSEENYDDPLAFKPERFLKANVTSKAHKAFIGFGYGLKICPGKYIAYAVTKLLLVKLIREFEIISVDHKMEITCDLLFRSVNGIPVAFRKRNI